MVRLRWSFAIVRTTSLHWRHAQMNTDRRPVRAPRLGSSLPMASALLVALLGRTTSARATVPEAPSTVSAVYVDPSPVTPLAPGAKIGNLFARNNTQPYVLQRLTKRTYWFQHQFYGTVFYVGDKGVLVCAPIQGGGASLKEAIARVTRLPVAAVVYSHDHTDHIGDTTAFLSGAKARIIASKAAASKMTFLHSSHPKPTEVVAWPRGTF